MSITRVPAPELVGYGIVPHQKGCLSTNWLNVNSTIWGLCPDGSSWSESTSWLMTLKLSTLKDFPAQLECASRKEFHPVRRDSTSGASSAGSKSSMLKLAWQHAQPCRHFVRKAPRRNMNPRRRIGAGFPLSLIPLPSPTHPTDRSPQNVSVNRYILGYTLLYDKRIEG